MCQHYNHFPNPYLALRYLLCWEREVSRSISVACPPGYLLLTFFGVCCDKPGPRLHRKPATQVKCNTVLNVFITRSIMLPFFFFFFKHEVSEVPEVVYLQHHRLFWIRKGVPPCSWAKAKRKNPRIPRLWTKIHICYCKCCMFSKYAYYLSCLIVASKLVDYAIIGGKVLH